MVMSNKITAIFNVIRYWVLLSVVILTPSTASATIVGSKHDMSTFAPATTDQICVYCHTPHNASTTITDAPLWNHAESTVTTYTLYDTLEYIGCWEDPGPTICDQPTEQPRAITKLCLSCHDGAVAVDKFGGMAGTTLMPGTPGTQGSANLGSDLSDDHPVSVKWNHQTVISSSGFCDGCHFTPPTNLMGVEFFGGYVECASCHDVHNNTPWTNLLTLPMNGEGGTTGSALCLRCHEMSPLIVVAP
jgi:hypothetical protein